MGNQCTSCDFRPARRSGASSVLPSMKSKPNEMIRRVNRDYVIGHNEKGDTMYWSLWASDVLV